MSKEALGNRILNDFTYHAPSDEATKKTYGRFRANARVLALLYVELCPEGRELEQALLHVEESLMMANAAIARQEPIAK